MFVLVRVYFRTHADMQLEVLALSHQVTVLQRTNPKPKLKPSRPTFMGLAVAILVSVAIRTRDRQAGHGRRLASSRFPLVLDLEDSTRKSRTTHSKGHTRTDPNHELR
jgi:hypothetical protein